MNQLKLTLFQLINRNQREDYQRIAKLYLLLEQTEPVNSVWIDKFYQQLGASVHWAKFYRDYC